MTGALSLVRIDHLQGPVGFLREVGAPIERFLRRASLPVLALGDPEAFVSSRLIYRFLDLVADAEGIPDLGVQSGLRVPVGEEPWTRAALSGGGTLRDALDSLCTLGRAESVDMHLVPRTAPGASWIEYRGSASFDLGGEFAEQYMVVVLTRFVSRAIEAPFRPRQIWLQSKTARALEPLPEFDRTHFETGRGVTRILVPRWLLARPLALLSQADRSGVAPVEEGFVGGLRDALRPYLAEGLPNIGVAAEMLGTSVRTLQRRLEEVGLSYSALTQELRRERAMRLVGESDLRLTDVALELGLTDAAHFTRAFRRWVGTTPSAYRRELQAAETRGHGH